VGGDEASPGRRKSVALKHEQPDHIGNRIAISLHERRKAQLEVAAEQATPHVEIRA
jgi:hypothetical protein